MTTEMDFDARSVEFFRRSRVLVRLECAEPTRKQPDGSDSVPSRHVRELKVVFSSATVVADPHSRLQIKSSTKESAI